MASSLATHDPTSSPYAPFLDVGGVSLDAFILDDTRLASRLFRARQATLRRQPAAVSVNKADIAAAVGRLSAEYGSFWVELGAVGEDDSAAQGGSLPLFSRDAAIAAARALFLRTNDDEKNTRSVNPKTGRIGRGFLPWGAESGAAGHFESKEGFAFGYDHTPAACASDLQNLMEELNVWPDSAGEALGAIAVGASSGSTTSASVREVLGQETLAVLNDVGRLLVRAYSLDFHGDEFKLVREWLSDHPSAKGSPERWNLTRVFRYFRSTKGREQMDRETARKIAAFGSVPHTDWGLLTVIVACDEPGLQLLQKPQDGDGGAETYVTVLPRFHEGKLFVNCGDFMSLMSGDRYVSPRHRVLAPLPKPDQDDVERTSIVHFYYPKYDVDLPPIEDLPQRLREKYSVFADQREQKDGGDAPGADACGDKRNPIFGDTIAKKWTQVAR